MTWPNYINPRLAKEIRVLMPAFMLTLLGSLLAGPSLGHDAESWTMILFSFGCVFMSVEIFGGEIQQGTLSLLLSQPISRSSTWREKMLVLAAALGLASLAVSTSVSGSSLAILGVPLCAFLTGPFWTLFVRQTLGAMVLTVVVPGFLLGMTSLLHDYFDLSKRTGEIAATVIMAVYSFGCYWAGYKAFRGLELAGSSFMTRELAVPAAFTGWLGRPTIRRAAFLKGPGGALLKKELRIQQMTFAAAALFSAIAVAGLMGYVSGVSVAADTKLSEIVWACDFCFYVVLLPLLAGAVAIAEEKAWQVSEWQMTLPASVFRQWVAKVTVALGSSLSLGVALPALAWWLGAQMSLGAESSSLPLGVLASFNVVLTCLAIYAGGICKTSARAVVLGMGIALGGFATAYGVRFANEHRALLQPIIDTVIYSARSDLPGMRNAEALVSCVASLVLAGLALRFSYTAYRHELPWRHRILQMRALVLVALGAGMFASAASRLG